jgi:hypothetical protein
MSIEKHLPFLGLVLLLLSALGLTVFDVPREPIWGAVFTGLTLSYCAWLTARDLRGPDEVRSAAVRFGLIFGAGLGAAVSVMVVVLMLAMPGLAEFISRISASDGDLSPANVGFGYGVLFTVVAMMASFAVGYGGWWLSRR